jgi:Leucine-rich repeat (LRR) protein
LELNDNKIHGADLKKLIVFKNLSALKVSNNKVNTVDEVKELAGLDKLIQLDLSENPICEIENYRD